MEEGEGGKEKDEIAKGGEAHVKGSSGSARHDDGQSRCRGRKIEVIVGSVVFWGKKRREEVENLFLWLKTLSSTKAIGWHICSVQTGS